VLKLFETASPRRLDFLAVGFGGRRGVAEKLATKAFFGGPSLSLGARRARPHHVARFYLSAQAGPSGRGSTGLARSDNSRKKPRASQVPVPHRQRYPKPQAVETR